MNMKGLTALNIKATADRLFLCEWSLPHGRLEERTSEYYSKDAFN